MGIVTKIVKQQARDRVSVFVDEKYSFSLNFNQFLKASVKKGQALTDSQITNFKDLSEFGKLKDRALAWALSRPRSEQELKNYLFKKTKDTKHQKQIIKFLTEKQYVDDRVFVEFWVKNRREKPNFSKRKIERELFSKGVSPELISEQLAKTNFNELENLRQLIEKKSKLSRYSDPQKLIAYCLRQGYSYDDIKTVMDSR